MTSQRAYPATARWPIRSTSCWSTISRRGCSPIARSSSRSAENLIEANSGAEALKHLMEREFALILLDVNMPGMDGFETASMIHQHPRFEKTPIIFVTAVQRLRARSHARLQARRGRLRDGADHAGDPAQQGRRC